MPGTKQALIEASAKCRCREARENAMNKYVVQYLTQEYGSLDDREMVVEAVSAAEAKAKVESTTRHAYYAELA